MSSFSDHPMMTAIPVTRSRASARAAARMTLAAAVEAVVVVGGPQHQTMMRKRTAWMRTAGGASGIRRWGGSVPTNVDTVSATPRDSATATVTALVRPRSLFNCLIMSMR
jgi:hypothetical protein